MVTDDLKANFNRILTDHGVAPIAGSLFDVSYRSPDVVFQSGVPGFAYPRRDPNPKVRFVGALLPYRATIATPFPHPERLEGRRPVVLIPQGTVEKDPSKLIVPALDALKDSGALLIVTTGNGRTDELRKSYPQDNVIIEDFVDFDYVLDRADLFICNGGYGSTLLSLTKGVPLFAAGVQEGKNDVNAHVDYFGVGINLHAERPKPAAIRRGAARILRTSAESYWSPTAEWYTPATRMPRRRARRPRPTHTESARSRRL